ncbi:MAG: ABC transporter permease [Nitrospinota bacterium]
MSEVAELFTLTFLVALLSAGLRLSTPILLGALGEVFAERSGILNIGVEGMMLMGALAGVLGAQFGGTPWAGLLLGMIVGLLVSLIHAFFTITLRGDQIVSGVAVNILALGLSTFIFRGVFGITILPVTVRSFRPIRVPGLAEIPVLGPVLFQQSALVYLALALVPVIWFVLMKTPLGLKIRTVGEHPKAADTVGINVTWIRYLCTALGGVLAGMGGCFLSIGQLNFFADNMTAGRGFIALAAVIFGRWNPFGVLGASVIFGVAEAVALRLQARGLDIPYEFLFMLPYVLTIVALAGLVGRTEYPKALGIPYRRGS